MTAKRLVPFLTAAFLLPVIPFMISRPYSGKLTSPSYPQGETIYESENDEPKIKVLMSDTGKIADIPLNEYIVSSVAAEMPAEYEPEALKAQAVAARSYTVYHMEAETASPGIVPEHKGAYICTDPSHCKAYITKEEMQKRWGDKFNEYYEKIYDAVKATEYETLSYNGRTANAVFHAISSGKTESAKDVWGSDIPYLVSADSLFDTESRGYLSTVEIDTKEFKEALESLRPLLTDTPNPVISRTESGGVKSIEIYGTEFTGSEIRSLFSLRSVNFELEIKDSVLFTVKGYGHGVGMSQFGAQQMALSGYSYKDILAHYYTGTEITQYDFSQKKLQAT